MDLFSGLWLADYVGSFLNAGGSGMYYFHYLPLQMEHGCNDSPELSECSPWTPITKSSNRWRNFSRATDQLGMGAAR